jgi:hypothetical protein
MGSFLAATTRLRSDIGSAAVGDIGSCAGKQLFVARRCQNDETMLAAFFFLVFFDLFETLQLAVSEYSRPALVTVRRKATCDRPSTTRPAKTRIPE